jgi:myo-inositol-1(or 4)-monophosphatase
VSRLARDVARDAASLLRARPERIDRKGAIDLVTECDLASEARVRERMARESPGVPVQGEEGGGVTTGLRWVLDPLDGTTNFVHGYPAWCVSLALVDGDRPLVGCVHDAVSDRGYLAWQGGGAWLGDTRLAVSSTSTPAEALGITGFPYDVAQRASFYLSFVERALRTTRGVRRSGSAALDLAVLARGQADFFWEFGLKPWDTAAGAVLVTEAGGRITRLDGSPWVPGAADVLATNTQLHDSLVAVLTHG